MAHHSSVLPPELREILVDLTKGYITAVSIEKTDFEVYGSKYFRDLSASTHARLPSEFPGHSALCQRVTQIKQEGQVKTVGELFDLLKNEPLLVNLRDELRKFIVAYLTLKPENVVAFGVEYFEKKLALSKPDMPKWRGSFEKTPKEASESELVVPRKVQRRQGVMSESVRPDDGTSKKLPEYPKTPQQKESLRKVLANVLLFKSLDADQMESIVKSMFKVEVNMGDFVIRQGEDGDYFYVIEKGQFEVFVRGEQDNETRVSTYNDSGSFGELALMYNMPRVATVKAASEGLLWALDRDSFRQIVVKSAFQKRRLYETLIAGVPILSILSQEERENLADSLQPKTFDDNTCIVKQGDVADGMYFVAEGSVEVVVQSPDRAPSSLGRIGKGGYFGELALVTRHPRAASVYARGPVKCAYLDVEAFERLLGNVKELMAERAKSYKIVEGTDKVEVVDANASRPGTSGGSTSNSRYSRPL